MNKFKLSEEDNKKFINIHKDIFPKRINDCSNKKFYSKDINKNYKLKTKINSIFNKSI